LSLVEMGRVRRERGLGMQYVKACHTDLPHGLTRRMTNEYPANSVRGKHCRLSFEAPPQPSMEARGVLNQKKATSIIKRFAVIGMC